MSVRASAAARVPSARDQHETAIIEWPTLPPSPAKLPEATAILADGDAGDRPVYLEHPGGRLEPMPRVGRAQGAGWNFGYCGGSPSLLVSAIVELIARSEGIDRDAVPRDWIDDQVRRASLGSLHIDIDDIRRRTRATVGEAVRFTAVNHAAKDTEAPACSSPRR